MGKYSLDAFERYPLVKLRPVIKKPEDSCYHLQELLWSELEPEGKKWNLPPQIGGGKELLRLQLDRTGDILDACGFIRRIASCYSGGKTLDGVVMTTGSFTGAALIQLVQAYKQGFSSTFLLAQPDTELMDLCRREGVRVGLWLQVTKGILDLRRSIAKENLAQVWRTYPVYIYAGRKLTPKELEAACRWHSSGADCMAPLGAHMALRRMMYPKDLTSGGALPLRMWWQNIGTAPVYQQTRVLLELRNETERFTISVSETMETLGLGDSTFNVTARLPQAPCGSYTLWCGLESDGNKLALAMEAPLEDGMYNIGQLTLDDVPRPYLSTMWEDQYGDGYYPLEDPTEPG